MNLLPKIHAFLAKVGGYLQSPVLLIIRLYWGYQFFIAGKGKLTHLSNATSFFASLHLPAPRYTAIMVSSTEVVGGILIFLGLFSRCAGLVLACSMSVALWTAFHEAVINAFNDPDKLIYADPFLFLVAAVLVLVFGPGKLSVDAAIGWEKKS